MGKSSGSRAIREVAEAVIALYPNVVGFGGFAECDERMRKFAALGFPNCWGCIDCTHVYMDKPRRRDGDEYCSGRNNRFFIVAQLVVDSDLKILDFCYGFPGTVGDARALKNSSMYRRALKGSLFLDVPNDPFRGERPEIVGVPGNGTWRDYVREWNALVQELERTEREVERLYKFLVARGDSITVHMRHGSAVCETEITQESDHARRWALSVVQRLRSSRANLQQCCDDIVTEHLQTRRQLDRCRQMSEDMHMQADQTSTALQEALVERDAVAAERGEAMAERDEVRRQLDAASRDLRVTRQQAQTAWQIYNDVVYGGQTARPKFPPPARDLCDGMGCMTLHNKGKAAGISTSTSAAQASKCVSCEDLTARVSEMESEIVKLQMTNELLTYPPSFWEDMEKELREFRPPAKFPPPPGRPL
ncbi:hypothetical protein CBR_g39980 [Chara braunii]|uniref:DDE Tnp4 domain-containing protein n=1 Tax=Chara braunii TaxID=69332 RepID=A0A388LSQ7_CHABU|nr:hypothetical protein CBR_g39980 [Chara braunii]|eukprot:GBG85337.1 hypothetical protein CBR_g39980 [Chara braunii]